MAKRSDNPRGGKKRSGKKRSERRPLAEGADPFDLYQRSVQGPEADIEVFETVFREIRDREPRVLREDFCGTGYLSAAWATSHPRRRAVGIDLHRPTLDWGRHHNLAGLDPDVRRRVRLIEADVRDGKGPRADIVCALNFSFCVFKARTELSRYFRAVHERLNDRGLFFAEIYGGTEAIIEQEEEREEDGFSVVWDQERYNPITNETLCHLHFVFEDGSRIDRAFTYDWRLWSIPEMREVLAEAGFAESRVYWEDVDEDGEGSGDYRATEKEENQETWLVYVVGIK